MFDIGWGELLVIGVLALIVVGPKELPRMLRTVGRYTAQARRMASDFQRSMEDAAREADIGDMKEMRDVASHLRDIRNLPSRSLDSFGRTVSAPVTPPVATPAPGATAAAPPASPTPPTTGAAG
jgi:sec-independent protein translocase protein TatB